MTSEFSLIEKQLTNLTTDEKLLLVEKIMADLRRGMSKKKPELKKQKTGLIYGEFKNSGRRMSTEEDFKLAEYHFKEDDWQ